MRLEPFVLKKVGRATAKASRWPVTETELARLLVFCLEHDCHEVGEGGVFVYNVKMGHRGRIKATREMLKDLVAEQAEKLLGVGKPLEVDALTHYLWVNRYPLIAEEYNAMLRACREAGLMAGGGDESYFRIKFPEREPYAFSFAWLEEHVKPRE